MSGTAIARFNRRDIAEFTRKVLLALERQHRLRKPLSEVSIALVDDATMRRLNRTFRHANKTTDVLTFPADSSYADPRSESRPLGDIVISVDQARRQAMQEKHSMATEVRYLIVHGILHALGYDHESDNGEMNELEVDVREAVGLD
ncbi:MAG TPA: rRNA maturation RNase YbeY [Thermoanaerobaculia bacterium]